ncbi:MAG: hypothetical protein CHACPFDD_03884 [Phycisphaerae bacterium]|nr:hypothetical protein [Phycisphaerae bacterium]
MSFDAADGEVGHAGEAWARFYLEHRPSLTAYALALTGDAADAADVLQDVLLRLVRERIAVLDQRAFVLRCLRNAAIDCRRRRASRGGGLGAAVEPAYLADAPEPDRAEQIAAARAALAALPQEQHEAIVLRIFCGVTFADAAEILARPIGTVASDYSRGLARLRVLLQSAEAARDTPTGGARPTIEQARHRP